MNVSLLLELHSDSQWCHKTPPAPGELQSQSGQKVEWKEVERKRAEEKLQKGEWKKQDYLG